MNNKNKIKTCKKCEYYDLNSKFCYSFTMDIFSTTTAKCCKNYKQIRDRIPNKFKYKHSSSNKKYNKY